MRIKTDSSPVEVMERWQGGQWDKERLACSKNRPVRVLYWKDGKQAGYRPTVFYCADMRIAKSVRLGLNYGQSMAETEILDFRNSD